MIGNLPQEVQLLLCDFLDIKSLLAVSAVSIHWNDLAGQEYIWRRLCKQRFGIDHFNHMFTIRDNLTAEEKKEWHIDDMKHILQCRKEKSLLSQGQLRLLRVGLEKSELFDLIRASNPLWLSPLDTLTQDLKWATNWKKQYAICLLDSRRRFITMQELVKGQFDFQFLHENIQGTDFEFPDGQFYGEFTADYKYLSNMFTEDTSLTYRFIGDPEGFVESDSRYEASVVNEGPIKRAITYFAGMTPFDDQIKYCPDYIQKKMRSGNKLANSTVLYKRQWVQVGDYPPLMAYRYNEGWMLANNHVVFHRK